MGDSQKLIGGGGGHRRARPTNLLLLLLLQLLPTALLILCSTPAAASVEQGKLYESYIMQFLPSSESTWPTDPNFGAIQ
jgi:hypothetical protein